QRWITAPSDFNADKKIGFGTRHPVKPMGIKARNLAEYFRIRMKAHPSAAAIMHFADVLESTLRDTTRKALPIKPTIASDFYFHDIRQSVHHRNAYAMEPVRCFIRFSVKFTTSVKLGHDHFERGLPR